jgi:hypothetical protein
MDVIQLNDGPRFRLLTQYRRIQLQRLRLDCECR